MKKKTAIFTFNIIKNNYVELYDWYIIILLTDTYIDTVLCFIKQFYFCKFHI